MKAITFVRSTLLFSFLFAFTILTISFAFAAPVEAQTVDATVVQTSQILPPGGNSCIQLPVSGFTPYVYNGALHAFQFDVPDSSYVAIGGTVGETVIPFNHFLRMTDGSGDLRMHADVPTTPIGGTLIVSVTMLSAKGPAQPVCMSIMLSAVAPAGGTPQVTATPIIPTTPTTPAAPATPSTPSTPTAPATPTTPTETENEEEPAVEEVVEEESATSTSAVTTMASSIADYCLEDGALRLWIILLAVYALIVLGTILGQPKLPQALHSQEWTATAIVVPFLLLFGFWYFAESCRTSAWIPVAATVIALAGLSAAFWERKDKGGMGSTGSGSVPKSSSTTSNVINLPGGKK